ncbi:toll/interleukin-1 receptor domain-containing protein [Dyella sp. 333MFSha]|uniref:toll/interleukin-1 receptor domain-containing protein n=1 Tax=Dyella sp. 333MFSha TaxID=1798240 RepID=UPI000B2785D9|nr:toll/interleukin-1 receptor domain-containing protein [Dyella sp. 333MFSha]
MSAYELAILGTVRDDDRAALAKTLNDRIAEFELVPGMDFRILDASTVDRRDLHAAFAVAYFGSPDPADVDVLGVLVGQSVPVIPVIGDVRDAGQNIPAIIADINAFIHKPADAEYDALAGALLECLGLLRAQRRVFISYRRVEAKAAAVDLHNVLIERGFDVFLDTHSIRPGETFQESLWHQLCDSDVMVMLDTPTYFESRWTREEIGRARAKAIHVLRVIWPGHTPDRHTDLAQTLYLEPGDLHDATGPLTDDITAKIAVMVERIRSQSIASRYMAMTGMLRAEVKKIGGDVIGVTAHRAVGLRLEDDRVIWAYPMVGVPTAQTLNDVASRAAKAGAKNKPILVYDDIGIGSEWAAHLAWLDDNIKSVHAIKVNGAAFSIIGLEG